MSEELHSVRLVVNGMSHDVRVPARRLPILTAGFGIAAASAASATIAAIVVERMYRRRLGIPKKVQWMRPCGAVKFRSSARGS